MLFRRFHGKAFPWGKAATCLGRGAVCRSGLFPRASLARGVRNASWGRAGPSGANVVRSDVRSLRIHRALARVQCQGDTFPIAIAASARAVYHVLREWGQKAPGFSRGMNGLSAVRAVLKNGILSTWTTHMKGTTSTWWCTTSSGVPSGGARCLLGRYALALGADCP
jgi:hypothetical protein